jgi:hypothetical protein
MVIDERASGLEDFTAPIKVFVQTTLQCKLTSVVATAQIAFAETNIRIGIEGGASPQVN